MNKVKIIAEAGVNHNGSLEMAKRLCEIAKESGADFVKFQTFITENIISKNTEMAKYQIENVQNEDSQFEMVKKLELGLDDFLEIIKHCKKIGISFLTTPDDKESLDFINDHLDEYIKVGSGEVTNFFHLEDIAKTGKKIILSTGMSNLDEVRK